MYTACPETSPAVYPNQFIIPINIKTVAFLKLPDFMKYLVERGFSFTYILNPSRKDSPNLISTLIVDISENMDEDCDQQTLPEIRRWVAESSIPA